MRCAIFGSVALFCLVASAWAEAPQAGIIHAQVKGKLIHPPANNHGSYYSVLAVNSNSNEIFPVALMRTEDKRRDLDAYLAAHEGKVVNVSGALAYYPHRADGGPEISIELYDPSQFSE